MHLVSGASAAFRKSNEPREKHFWTPHIWVMSAGAKRGDERKTTRLSFSLCLILFAGLQGKLGRLPSQRAAGKTLLLPSGSGGSGDGGVAHSFKFRLYGRTRSPLCLLLEPGSMPRAPGQTVASCHGGREEERGEQDVRRSQEE